MVTVRFPSGFSVQYNDANYVLTKSDHFRITRSVRGEEKVLHALVPFTSGALIEFSDPCKTYDGNSISDDKILDMALDVLRSRPPYRDRDVIREIKDELRSFDARSGGWKD